MDRQTNAVEIDITGAYLNAMSMPLPNLAKSMYFYNPEQSWRTIRTNFGFVEALVNVPKSLEKGLPPLPLYNGRGTIYPTGIFRGVWSIDLLRYAEEECGVKVIDTFEHACFLRQFLEPYFQPLANQWFRIENRSLAKPMYTRFWGKWGNRGGYVGYPARLVGNRDGAFPSNGFDWYSSMVEQDEDTEAKPYRPDIAATIAAYNHIAVHRALRILKPESIIAVHVDAIWTDDIEGAQRVCDEIQPDRLTWMDETDEDYIEDELSSGNFPGQWRIKNSGRDRHLACGVYYHGNQVGHSGLKGKPRSEEELVRRYTLTHSPKDTQELAFAIEARNWNDNLKPLQSIHARSTAPHLKQTNHQRVIQGSPVYSSKYNNLGWLQR